MLHEKDPKERLRKAARKAWVVYSKPPFAGPEQVLKYLGRYTHRVAISNERLISIHHGRVTFRWKDRAHGNAERSADLDAGEFMRRFLLHVVPHGLMRIRHYGLLANAVVHTLIPRCKELLGVDGGPPVHAEDRQETETWQDLMCRLTGRDVTLCPRCKTGHLVVKEIMPAVRPGPDCHHRARSP